MIFFRNLSLFICIAATWPQFAVADAVNGEEVYSHLCSSCHGFSGNGRRGLAPPLRGSQLVNGDMAGLINVVMNGRSDTLMVAFSKNMNDRELAAVINYVRASFGPADKKVAATDIGLAR